MSGDFLVADALHSPPELLGLVLAGQAREPHQPGPSVLSEEQIRSELGSLFDIVRLREIRFDQFAANGTHFLGLFYLLLRRRGERP